MTFVGRLLRGLQDAFGGRGRALAAARKAEMQGDMDRAIALFEDGGRDDEARRVRRTKAIGALAASVTPVTSTARQELVALAGELESLGEYERAADGYAQARDLEGQARALGRAGQVERLDDLLVVRQARSRGELAARGAHDVFAMLAASGKRREAAALARESTDDGLRDRGRDLEARRVSGPVVRAAVLGRVKVLLLGDRVVIGRSTGDSEAVDGAGTLRVASAAVSRRHVAIERRGSDVVVRDLGSHNGTTLQGVPLTGEIVVGEGVELRLGSEVPLVVRPATDWPGAVAVEIAGARYLAPLGPARLGLSEWRLEWSGAATGTRAETWVELVTTSDAPAYAGGLELAERVTLLLDDAIAARREGDAVLTLLGREP